MTRKNLISWPTGLRQTAVAALAALVVAPGCGTEAEAEYSDWSASDGIPELGQALTPFNGACAFDNTASAGRLTLTAAAGGLLVVSKRSTDSALLINGFDTASGSPACPITGVIGVTAGKVVTTGAALVLKKIVVNGGAAADTVIIDYVNGSFALGSLTATGIDVDFATTPGGADAFKFRGRNDADTLVLDDGTLPNKREISFALTQTFADISVLGVTTLALAPTNPVYTFALGAGNDVLTTGGRPVTSPAVPRPLSSDVNVFAGLGDDDITDASKGKGFFSGGDGTVAVGATAATAGLDKIRYPRLAKVFLSPGDNGTTRKDGELAELDDVLNDFEQYFTGSVGDVVFVPAEQSFTVKPVVTIDGGAGDDLFIEGGALTSKTVFTGGAGKDTVDYGARTNALTIIIGAGAADGEGTGASNEGDDVSGTIEQVFGGGGVDTITGQGQTAGNVEFLCGGAGDDKLAGGPGNDVFLSTLVAAVLIENPVSVVVGGGCIDGGIDTYDGGADEDTVDYSGAAGPVFCAMTHLTTATAPAPVAVNGGTTLSDDIVTTLVENFIGTPLIDTVLGNDANNSIDGLAGADVIDGGNGNDTIDCGADPETFVLCGPGDDISNACDTLRADASCEL